MKGISIITHQGEGWYCGQYRTGVFSDNCEWNRKPANERKGWGFKLDLYLGRVLRPVPVISQLWDNRPIYAVMGRGLEAKKFFGDKLYALLKLRMGNRPPREVYQFKYPVTNPWYGKYMFILDSKIAVPVAFLSISTPWKSFYIGFKTYGVEPLENDMTWAKGVEPYRASCPSVTIRSDRG